MTPLSLYLHIPFCRHRCAYCDFNTYAGLDALKGRYAAALGREIAQVGALARVGGEKRPLHTIFFGGGTPSLMSPALMDGILTAVHRSFAWLPGAEVSMEANPNTVDGAYLTAVRRLGINRISFGVQSVVDSELALLERAHDFGTVVTAVSQAREAGFDNVSMDLIYGVPGQTMASWRKSVEAALDLGPEHLSLYCLTIEQGTPMHRWLQNGRISPPDPDLAADQYGLALELLAERGFVHYEISNWAQPGRECRHNVTYWRNGEYLGLGAGAHGHAGGCRYVVVKQPHAYIQRLESDAAATVFPLSTAVAESHPVEAEEGMSDTIITQLRLLQEGLDLDAFAEKFGRPLSAAYPGVMEQLVDWGLLRVGDGRLRLTEKGYFLSNQVFYRFM